MSLADSLRLTLFMLFNYDRNNGYAGDCINCITGGGKSLPIGAYFSFVGVLAEKLPKVCVSFRKEDLIERGFSAQLHSLLPVDSSYSKSILQQLYDFVPASTYNLDEYVRFRTVRDVFVEFVKGIRISQLEGKDVIRILQPDIRRFSNMKTLVLLDGIPLMTMKPF